MSKTRTTTDVYLIDRVIEEIPASVSVWNKEGVCLKATNGFAGTIFGLEASFIEGQHFSKLPSNQSLRLDLEALMGHLRIDKHKDYFHSQTTRNGRVISFFNTVKSLGEGQFLLISKVFGSELWQPFVYSDAPHILIDDKGTIVYSNPLAIEKAILPGESLTVKLRASDRKILSVLLKRSLHEGATSKANLFIEGAIFHVKTTPVRIGELQFVWFELEDKTNASNEKIREQGVHLLLNDALSKVEESVFLIHENGRIVFRNPQGALLFRKKPHDVSELLCEFQNRLFDAETQAPFPPENLDVFKAIEGIPTSTQRFFLQLGEEFCGFESRIQKISARIEHDAYFLWTLRDVTRDARRIAGLEEGYADMDHFMRATAHDLQTPVNNLKNLGRLIEKTKDPDQVKRLAAEIQKSTDSLNNLFTGMLELAQLRDQENEVVQLINAEPIIEDVINGLEGELRDSQISLKMDVQLEQFHYHPGFFRSIVQNLLANAVKYSDLKKQERWVKLKLTPTVNGVWLIVEDNGIGIDLMKAGDDLFKPFKRFTSQSHGSGVGLSLVKRFVERNGGEIKIESNLGLGTRFQLFLRSYQDSRQQYTLFD